MKQVHNFYPGPAILPQDAIRQAQEELCDCAGSGISLLEMSHRSPEYAAIHAEATGLIRQMLQVPDNYHILWLQAGASMQFAMIPLNLLGQGQSADYALSGLWSEKAYKEAGIVGSAREAASSKDDNYRYIPKDLDLDPQAQYLHITSNNTIMGAQYFEFPDSGGVPLVADMSSDIFWRFIDVKKFGIIYAGAHKNLGPSGVTLVIIRDDLLKKCNPNLPTMLKYQTHVDNDSMYNTPPTFTIYMVRNVLRWIKQQGGPEAMEKLNLAKAGLLYDFLDSCGGFYSCPVRKEDRSVMNAIVDLPSKELEDRFVAEGKEAGFLGLRNFHPDGGGRITMYNALPISSVEAVIDFMKDFMAKNG